MSLFKLYVLNGRLTYDSVGEMQLHTYQVPELLSVDPP
ncbi:UNVERIFIED_ORG: hypothetical protein J2Y84_005216 [Pseudomonas reinekei]